METNNPHVLGEAPIGKLLWQYSIPAIIGMTLTSLYNIIDSIFIGHGVGALAISALAITFPLMNLIIAFSTLVEWAEQPSHPSAWDKKTGGEPNTFWAT